MAGMIGMFVQGNPRTRRLKAVYINMVKCIQPSEMEVSKWFKVGYININFLQNKKNVRIKIIIRRSFKNHGSIKI